MSDPEELKAKYAEIAWLKKQIEEKKAARGRRSDKNGISKPSRKQFPTPQIDLKPLKVDSGDENYISSTTSRGMTLVNTNIYEREQKLQLLKAEAARKLQIEAQERNRQRKWKPRIDKNKTKTDHSDRIAISDQIFAKKTAHFAEWANLQSMYFHQVKVVILTLAPAKIVATTPE